MIPESPFFEIPQSQWICANRSAFAIWDGYPVSAGHALVVTRRLISDWWEATPDERADIFELVDLVRAEIQTLHSPDGFNVGFNAGNAAGQTINHLHIHIIPRYTNDVADPRGGIRHVIPTRGNYLAAKDPAPHESLMKGTATGLESSTPVLVDGQVRLLLPELVKHLRSTEFDRIDIVVSFIKMSGLEMLTGAITDALDRSAEVRVLTTDYLGLTERAALSRLHDLMQDYPALLAVRLFHDPDVSFHPKAYLFHSTAGQGEAAFVGSSNISGSGLNGGIEWNLLVGSVHQLHERFVMLWLDQRSLPLNAEFIDSYQPAPDYVPAVVEIAEEPLEPPKPRPIQEEALAALHRTRNDGFRAGMVTMATGLGKTWLAAFDSTRQEVDRVLFVAHREEILRQSRDIFRQVARDSTMGLYFGGEKQPQADFVFATVQTLSRNLGQFAPDEFDYIVVDEFHHAAADSYRKVLDHFAPDFLLGLTATPERTDGADLLSLCADNLVYECDLVEGIARNELVPFHYWGIRDTVDFEPIPWRNGRFDTAELEAAVETQERAEAAFREWASRRGGRTLAFCASTHHADFMSSFFQERGVLCASVHSGATSAPRNESIDALRTGQLEVVFSVDIFNEGLDVPDIDTVLMLRPTESPIIFLQQLGRGLRTIEGKSALTVIDFIGNHRSFLLKPRTLLSLGSRTAPTTLQVLMALENKDFHLPPGCSVDYDLTVVEMLRALSRSTSRDAIEDYCRSYMEEEGLRPTAAQAFRAGHDPAVLRGKYGSWFEFLHAIDLLGERESQATEVHGNALRALQVEPITKSYKLVTVRALLHDGVLRSGDDIAHNAETSRRILLSDPRLARDIPSKEFPNLAEADPKAWMQYWRKWPIAHLTGEGSSSRTNALFSVDADRIIPTFSVDDALGDVFDSMVAEIIEYRLARYVIDKDAADTRSWTCRITLSDGQPVIRMDRRQSPDLPEGLVRFHAGGREFEGAFGKGAMTRAALADSTTNALPDLLREWFGPSAGQPGTTHQVRLEDVDGVLNLQPVESAPNDVEIDYVPLLASYTVACDLGPHTEWSSRAAGELPVKRRTDEPLTPGDYFVCFAHNNSMDGGRTPIKYGDPLLFRWIPDGYEDSYLDQTVLASAERASGSTAELGILRHENGRYRLEASNPASPSSATPSDLRPVAQLVTMLSQSEINPLAKYIGEPFKRLDIPPLYGFEFNRGNWASGHVSLPDHAILFVTLEKRNDATQYVDHFENAETFVWSSQLSTSPEGRKGREILNSLETGKSIELWVRRRSQDIAFIYLGRVVPLNHEGSQPMSVTFRLLTPPSGDIQQSLGLA